MCIRHDICIVNHWLSMLNQYKNLNSSIENLKILELGPGSDLGIALYLLSKRVSEYTAIDINRLIDKTPDNFYEKLVNKIKSEDPLANTSYLLEELKHFKQGKKCNINYIHNKDFNILSELKKDSIDIVFSSAAFEHFDSPEKTIDQLSKVVKKGGISIITIDLKTHSRWIRDRDPNNIYRYSDFIYNLFSFSGIPNRIRPYQYINYFKKYGWKNVEMIPNVSDQKLSNGKYIYNDRFNNKNCQMELLTITICATKC